MKTEDVIRMAREAGFEIHERKQQARVGADALFGIDSTPKLLKFANLVAAAEREACLNVALAHAAFGYSNIPAEIASSIIARGEL